MLERSDNPIPCIIMVVMMITVGILYNCHNSTLATFERVCTRKGTCKQIFVSFRADLQRGTAGSCIRRHRP